MRNVPDRGQSSEVSDLLSNRVPSRARTLRISFPSDAESPTPPTAPACGFSTGNTEIVLADGRVQILGRDADATGRRQDRLQTAIEAHQTVAPACIVTARCPWNQLTDPVQPHCELALVSARELGNQKPPQDSSVLIRHS